MKFHVGRQLKNGSSSTAPTCNWWWMRSALVTDFPLISILLNQTLSSLPFLFSFMHLVWPHRRRFLTRRLTAGDSVDEMLQESKTLHLRCALAAALFFATVSLSCLILFRDVDSYRFFSGFSSSYALPRFPTFFPLVTVDPAVVSSVAFVLLFVPNWFILVLSKSVFSYALFHLLKCNLKLHFLLNAVM